MFPAPSPGQGRRRLAALAGHLVVPPEPHTGPKLLESSAEAAEASSGGSGSLQIQDAGVVYANPKPYLRAANAWHPSVVALPSGRWLVGFDR